MTRDSLITNLLTNQVPLEPRLIKRTMRGQEKETICRTHLTNNCSASLYVHLIVYPHGSLVLKLDYRSIALSLSYERWISIFCSEDHVFWSEAGWRLSKSSPTSDSMTLTNALWIRRAVGDAEKSGRACVVDPILTLLFYLSCIVSFFAKIPITLNLKTLVWSNMVVRTLRAPILLSSKIPDQLASQGLAHLIMCGILRDGICGSCAVHTVAWIAFLNFLQRSLVSWTWLYRELRRTDRSLSPWLSSRSSYIELVAYVYVTIG